MFGWLMLIVFLFVIFGLFAIAISSVRTQMRHRRGPLMASPATLLGCRGELPPGTATPMLQQTADSQEITLRYVPGQTSTVYYASFGLPAGQTLELPVDLATVQLLSTKRGQTGQLSWRNGSFVDFQSEDLR